MLCLTSCSLILVKGFISFCKRRLEGSDVTGVAGFAQPGDYVDVMLVSGNVEPHKVVSELILQNVLLLAINKSVDNTSTAPPPQQKDG